MRAYDRWRTLTRREKRLAVEAAALVLAYAIRVRAGATPRLRRASASRRNTSIKTDDLHDVVTAVARAARYTPGATCLARALALQSMLTRRGIPTDLRLGVRTDAGALFAHAWVECQGMTVNGPSGDGPFVVLR